MTNDRTEFPTIVVFKRSLAERLIQLGHTPVRIVPNYKNKKFLIYRFKKTEEFDEDFNRLINEERGDDDAISSNY